MAWIMTPTTPRPPWWRRRARREWDRKARAMTAIVNQYAGDILARAIDEVSHAMLWGN